MNDYAAQIKPEDRWAIVAYIRALQISQNTKADQLSDADRQQLERAGARKRRLEDCENPRLPSESWESGYPLPAQCRGQISSFGRISSGISSGWASRSAVFRCLCCITWSAGGGVSRSAGFLNRVSDAAGTRGPVPACSFGNSFLIRMVASGSRCRRREPSEEKYLSEHAILRDSSSRVLCRMDPACALP